MAVSGIIFQMITLFIMMFAGYLAARAGLISVSYTHLTLPTIYSV